ncbi:hypothetical protein [Nocardioides halotolerans]|uniref:hypothetical protein n=1 Tax=Nocardioides halotolerans TaxID=433660 RepID=UPI000685781C|nr:hypothetical protein [Nocardioides halotolerans]
MTPDQARQRFAEEHPRYAEAALAIEALLRAWCTELRVGAVVDAREKGVGSFVKKIFLNDYIDPWREITDKVGARIIVENTRDLERLRAALEQDESARAFAAHEIVDKSEEASEDRLHYPGIHAQIAVPGVTTSDGQPIEAELQLRTRAQDLWAVVSHKLDYKGAVKPARHTRRRILRLSVLTEMFDQEVGTAMKELAADPAYEVARYLQVVEAEYLRFVAEPGNDLLSLEVLEVLLGAPADLPPPEAYGASLREFASLHHDKLQDVYDTYGAHTEWAQEPAYWLFSQPESMMTFHLVESAPMALASVVWGTQIERVVERLYWAWGRAMPGPTD